MKHILFIGILFLSLPASTQTRKIAYRYDDYVGNQWRGMDSILYDYNASSNITWLYALKGDSLQNWNPSQRVTYTYDASQHLTQKIREKGSGASWVLDNKYDYTYDGSGNNTQIDYSVWNGSAWSNAGKVMYTGYNSFGKYAQEMVQSWVGGSWMNMSMNNYAYVNNQYLLESKDEYVWDIQTIAWKKYQRHFYNYLQDSLASDIFMQPDTFNNWKKINRLWRIFNLTTMKCTEAKNQLYDSTQVAYDVSHTLYLYSATNKVIESDFELALGGSLWDPQSRQTFIYDANDSLKEWFRQNNNNGWVNDVRGTYTYQGGLLDEELQYTGAGGTSWAETKKINYTYNSNDSLIYRFEQNYQNGNYVPYRQEFFYYSFYPLSVQTVGHSRPTIYPNPVNDQLHITLKASSNGVAQVYVLDMYGRKRMHMVTPVQSGSNTIDLRTSGLETGCYLLRVETNNETSSTNFLKN